MTESVECSKAVKKSRVTENKHSMPAGDVREYSSFYFLAGFWVFLHAVNRTVCRVAVATVSFAPFCLGAHYHNPQSEQAFYSPFVLSVLMTGN